MPTLIHRGTGLAERAGHAHRLHRERVAPFPRQIVAGDEVPEPGVKWPDVIVLQIDLNEGFPVVGAIVYHRAVEHVARKVETLPGCVR